MIRIHIRRKVPENKADDLKLLINRLRGVTMGTPGYIAGETLKRIDKPGESLVVTKWQSEFIGSSGCRAKNDQRFRIKLIGCWDR